jgi:hypothetical protein
VFGGFAARELAVRIDHIEPDVVLGASCGVEPSRLVDYRLCSTRRSTSRLLNPARA